MPFLASTGGSLAYGRPAKAAASGGTGGSLFFSGLSSPLAYLSYANNSAFNFAINSSFTIEWFQYMQTGNSFPRVFSRGSYGAVAIAVSIESGTFYLWVNNTFIFSSSLANYLNQWVHFAICRSSGTIRVFQNGTQIGSSISNSAAITSATYTLNIGNESTVSSGAAFKGYITNFRWNTTALYTGNFTRPSAPLTAVAGTVLLLLATNTGTATNDSSGNGRTVTNNNVTWNTLNPFP